MCKKVSLKILIFNILLNIIDKLIIPLHAAKCQNTHEFRISQCTRK